MKPNFKKREIKLAIATRLLLDQLDSWGIELDGYLSLEKELMANARKMLRPYARLNP